MTLAPSGSCLDRIDYYTVHWHLMHLMPKMLLFVGFERLFFGKYGGKDLFNKSKTHRCTTKPSLAGCSHGHTVLKLS